VAHAINIEKLGRLILALHALGKQAGIKKLGWAGYLVSAAHTQALRIYFGSPPSPAFYTALVPRARGSPASKPFCMALMLVQVSERGFYRKYKTGNLSLPFHQ
jgi:hypothetical protein